MNAKDFEPKVECEEKLLELFVKFMFKFGKSLKCSFCYFYHDYIMLERFLGRIIKVLTLEIVCKSILMMFKKDLTLNVKDIDVNNFV